MSDFTTFVPLAKVDMARREVWGWAAEEAPDKTGEIMDYAASKLHFAAWSEEIKKASGGKSLGNVRAMHGKVAAGKLIALEARDDLKKFWIGVKVVDDAEWNKCEEGVYTGFSVGGRYGKRWPDPNDARMIRYEAVPVEISLVDNPCQSGARFEVVKADGTSEMRDVKPAAAGGETPSETGGTLAGGETVGKEAGQAAVDALASAAQDAGGASLRKTAPTSFNQAREAAALSDRVWKWICALERSLDSIAFAEELDVAQKVTLMEESAAQFVEAVKTLGGMPAEEAAALFESRPDEPASVAKAVLAASGAAASDQPAGGEAAEEHRSAVDLSKGAPGTPVFDAEREIESLKKAMGDGAGLAKGVDGLRGDLGKLAGDVAAVAAVLEAIGERVERLEKSPVPGGPVLRSVPGVAAAAGGASDAEALAEILAKVSDPNLRAELGQRLTALQIRAAQAAGGHRVSVQGN